MGDFRVVIEAAGPHGCQRELGDGKEVYGCRRTDCPDCLVREFLNYFRYTKGYQVSKAEITHWPSDMADRNYTKDGEVKDNLLTFVRTGSFK
jgi:hypothetical protein